MSVVVYFYECHTIDYLCLNFVVHRERIKRYTSGGNRPGSGRSGAAGASLMTEGQVVLQLDDNISFDRGGLRWAFVHARKENFCATFVLF
jgi:hypothetical protein